MRGPPGDPDLRKINQTLVDQYDYVGTQALISTSKSHLFLAFRGTEENADIKADLRYVKVDFPGGGRVHVGFYTAFRNSRDRNSRDSI